MRIVCCVDGSGRIARTTKSFEKVAGPGTTGQLLSALLPAPAGAGLRRALQEAQQQNGPAVFTAALLSQRGLGREYRWHVQAAAPAALLVCVGTPSTLPAGAATPPPPAPNGRAQSLQLQPGIGSILTEMSDALLVINSSWHISSANPQACRLLSISSEGLFGKHLWEEVFPEKVGGTFHQACLKAAASQQQQVSENSFAGDRRMLESRIYPSAGGLLLFFSDHSETQAPEQKSERVKQQLRNLQDAVNASSIVSTIDARGCITWTNDNFCAISQYSLRELMGQKHGLLASKHAPPTQAREIMETLTAGRMWKGEACTERKDGIPIWVKSTVVPFLDDAGALSHSVIICEDITEKKKREKALLESEKLYRSLIENDADAVFITDLQGTITLTNKHAAALTGLAEEALLQQSLLPYLPAEARRQLSSGLPLILQGNKLEITTKIQAASRLMSVAIDVIPIRDNETISRFYFKFRDISSKVDYERDLALLNNTTRALSSAPTLKEGLTAVIQLLCAYTGFQYGEFWMPLLGQSNTRMKAHWPSGKEFEAVTEASLSRTWNMHTDKKHLFGTGTHFFVPDISQSPQIRRKQQAMACGLKAFISIPITYRNRMLGVAGLWTTETNGEPGFDPLQLQNLLEKLGGEIERRQNHEEFKKFFALTPDLMGIIGFDNQPKRANPALQSLLGYRQEDMDSISIAELVHPDDREKCYAALKKAHQGKASQNLELRVRCKDGSYCWLSISTQSSLPDDLMYLVARDITQQKKQLEEIKRITTAIENTSDAIGIATSAGQTIYTNRAFAELFGWQAESMNQRGGPRGLFVDASLPDQILATLSREGRWQGDSAIFDASGARREVNLRADAVLDEQGNFKYLVGIFEDIGEKNKAEQESGNEVYIIDAHSRKFSYINNKGLENLGYTRQEIPMISPLEVNPDYERLSYKKLFYPLLMGSVKRLTYQTTHKRKDGSLYPVEVYLTLFQHGQETSIMAHAIDISERRKAEEALRMINERYRLVTRATQDAIWDWDLKTNGVYYGEGYITLFGYDLTQPTYEQWADNIHPEDRERVIGNLQRMAACSQNKEWTIEYRFRCSDGSYKFVKDRGYAIHDEQGQVIRMTGALSDITEQKTSEQLLKQFNAELEAKVTQKTARLATTLTKMQQEMLAREQVEANLNQSLQEKEVLLKEIHHRVKNNMAIISGLLSLQARHSRQEEVKALLNESQQRIKSMALIHELLYQHRNLSRIHFQKYIQELIEGISYSFRGRGTEVVLEIDADAADLDIVQAIPCGLILNELITNCYKYAFEGKPVGKINVDFKHNRGYYTLQVTDNGKGLPPGFGTGQMKTLGMQLVTQLVRQLGGSLHSRSQNGAQFRIDFKDSSYV
jgi:PAS domain S-box-containing protein